MAGEREYPKANGDVLYASEVNKLLGFGDGSDGAFNETAASTTNLVQGTIYQYTSFTLGADHTISAASTSTEPIIILVQGDCTINGTINLSGKGATTSYGTYVGSVGGNAYYNGSQYVGGIAGLRLPPGSNFTLDQFGPILNGTKGGSGIGAGSESAGGGGGASSQANGNAGGRREGVPSASGGTSGGAGGCTILIIVGGNLTFGADSSIDVSGADGAATSANQSGGGGGGSGDILILYNGSKTDNGLATDVTGGSGAVGSGDGSSGADGAAGQSKIVAWNTILW